MLRYGVSCHVMVCSVMWCCVTRACMRVSLYMNEACFAGSASYGALSEKNQALAGSGAALEPGFGRHWLRIWG